MGTSIRSNFMRSSSPEGSERGHNWQTRLAACNPIQSIPGSANNWTAVHVSWEVLYLDWHPSRESGQSRQLTSRPRGSRRPGSHPIPRARYMKCARCTSIENKGSSLADKRAWNAVYRALSQVSHSGSAS
jgi:hypothetical protein